MTITLIILAVSIVFFVWGIIRSDLVALCALIALTLFSVLTPQEALAGFSNPIIIMLVCVFIVSGGIFRTGLTEIVSRKILALAGTSQTRIYLLIMLVTAGIGAFVSNTGTVALMMPIVVSMAAAAGVSARRYLMPLAFVSSMGGMLTLIGTPPNLVISDALQKAGYGPLSFFAFLPVGLVCVTFGIIAMAPLSKLLEKKDAGKKQTTRANTSLYELAQKYQLTRNISRVRALPGSFILHKRLRELELPQRYGLSVAAIVRPDERRLFTKARRQNVVDHTTTVNDGDILQLIGDFEKVQHFAEENSLEVLDADHAVADHNILRFDTIGIAELVLLSTSRLVNVLVKNSRFREKHSCTILGIQREHRYILQALQDEKLRPGDLLLVQGNWEDIAKLGEEINEWVVVGQPLKVASSLTLDEKAPVAGIILIGMILLMVFNIVPASIAIMLAALAMVFTGCLRNAEEAYTTINWEGVVLVAAMLPMATAVEKTGLAALISEMLTSGLGGYSPAILLAGIYLAASLLTLFISNTATAVLFAPIAMKAALDMGLSPYPFLFAVAVAASMCFASPFSTAPNALVMSAGRYSFVDYIKVGLPLQIAFGIVMTLVLPLIFPFAAG